MSSLVYLLVWSPPLHIPYISSPNQCLFCNTCPYNHNVFCCSTKIISSVPCFCLNSSLPCSILLRTQLLFSLPLLINDISLLVILLPVGITTNTSATYTTRPSCSLLHWLLAFSTLVFYSYLLSYLYSSHYPSIHSFM